MFMDSFLAELHMPITYSSLATSNKSRTKESFHKEMFLDITFQTNIALKTPHNFSGRFAMYKLTT